MVRVGAVGDIHSPKFLEEFKAAIKQVKCSDLDLFLLAGDLILKGKFDYLKTVLDVLDQNKVECPVVGCFGNEEYSEVRDHVRELAGDRVKFLDDESLKIEVAEFKVGIVGSQGSLDVPTPWQSRNMPGIGRIYTQRIETISELLTKLDSDIRVLLTHYPPTYKVLEGERRMFYKHIGCKRCERIIAKSKVDFVICAHAHMGKLLALVNGVPVYNVSLPASKKISVIEVATGEAPDRYIYP